jgi:L-fuculose-phosphate aldolase
VATPTATSKRLVDRASLLVVDRDGNRVSGTTRRFGEINLHLAVYGARDDVGAVVHAHPPNATAIACSGARLIERPFIAEAVVSLGASIPTVPFAPPGPEACRALAPHLPVVDVVLLANHGVLAWGADVETAFLRMELVEHLATIAIAAQSIGGVRPLPEAAMAPLLEARANAGLGKAAERAVTRVEACAPPPAGSHVQLVEARGDRGAAAGELAAIVREEVRRVLDRE